MRTKLIKLAFILALPCVLISQVKFDSLSAYRFNRVLASKEFQGRKSGTQGGKITEEWIAKKFKEFGLKPFGDNGTFFQNFKILSTQEKVTELELLNGRKGKVRYSLGDDFTILTNSGSGDVEAEVVFVGYGISSPQKNWDDYAGVDVKGKVVLLVSGAPDAEKFKNEISRGYKIKTAFEKGAAAVLYYRGRRAIRGGAIPEKYYQPKLPALWISRKIVDDIFYNTGLSFDALLKEIKTKPHSFNTGKIVRVKTKVIKLDGNVRNVVGLLPGTDPVLKNEYIVVGAHMDHLGVDAEGSIYPGADDNGSGTCVVMELGRSMVANGERPKRSIIFALFAAEEQGLLGSKHFVENPPVKLDKIVAMFNFDMVGRRRKKLNVAGTENYPELWKLVKSFIPKSELKYFGKFRSGANSDHYPFQSKGIPALFFISGGPHPEYHRSDDTNDKIQPWLLGWVGNLAYKFILGVANHPEKLKQKNRFEKYIYANANTVKIFENEPEIEKLYDKLKSDGVELAIIPVDNNRKTKLEKIIEKISEFESLPSDSFRVVTGNSLSRHPDVLNIAFSIDVKNVANNPEVLKPLALLGVKFVTISDADKDIVSSPGFKKFIKLLNGGSLKVIPFIMLSDSNLAHKIAKLIKTPFVVKDFPTGKENEIVLVDVNRVSSNLNFDKLLVDVKTTAGAVGLIKKLLGRRTVGEVQKIFGGNLIKKLRNL